MIVLSHYQALDLLQCRKAGSPICRVSLDLAMTSEEVELTEEGVLIRDQNVSWADIKKISETSTTCFSISGGIPKKIQIFSEEHQRFYSLFPTRSAPTMIVSGFPMHRIKDTDPWADTSAKITALGTFKGNVLDTTMGLGYTAIQASKMASAVTTIELDPAVEQICRLNPWSAALFSSEKIQRLVGDAFEVVATLPSFAFSAVIHDPPTLKLAGHLYSKEFYESLHRVLAYKGKLFHYTGDPESALGRSVTQGVIRRLQEAGFTKVHRKPEAFGLLALK
jgi:predicted methyltransferase